MHDAHAAEVVAEVELLYWPALHAVHVLVPVASELYVPAAQLIQPISPAAAYVPAPQTVHTKDVFADKTVPNWPLGHAVQTSRPDRSAYVPAAQAVQLDTLPAL